MGENHPPDQSCILLRNVERKALEPTVARIEGGENQQAESLTPWGCTTIRKRILCFWVRDGGTLMIFLLLYTMFFGGCFFMVLESCACSVNALLLRCTLPPTWALCPGFQHRLKSVEWFVGFIWGGERCGGYFCFFLKTVLLSSGN